MVSDILRHPVLVVYTQRVSGSCGFLEGPYRRSFELNIVLCCSQYNNQLTNACMLVRVNKMNDNY